MKYCALDQGLRDKVMEMKAMLDQAFAAVRNVASILRPVVLDMGLDAALRWLCSEFQRKRGMPCNYRSEVSAGAIDEQTSMVLFRIVQESLTNIGRHAGPAYVDVQLLHRDGTLQLSVRDDGRGFVREAQAGAKRYGLLGMQERALALGGQLDIRSAPGQGTCVSLSIPWPPAAAERA
jgi:signal transduction histidine kinase